MQKSVVITGGNRGIGRSLTKCFVEAGYNVVVGARSSRDIEQVAKDQIKFVPIDVRNEADHKKLVEVAVDWSGQLDVYVNNAGFSEWRPIEHIDEDFFTTLIDTNLKGAFWGCKAAAAVMQKHGAIINISSIAGKRGSSNNSMYCASKFGMNGLTQSLAKELGPRGIRVNALCPVLIKTEGLLEALKTKWSPSKEDPDVFIDNFTKANSALGTLPSGEDVGDMCVYLASPQAAAVTGQCINIDCGVFPQ